MNLAPTEIILSIFENISYWDLKLNVQLVCRRFRALLIQPRSSIPSTCCGDAYDGHMYHFGGLWYNSPTPTNSTTYMLHPALITKEQAQEVNSTCRDKSFVERKVIPFTSDIPSLPYENATYPAVSRMALRINGRQPIYIEGSNGGAVTTKDILDRHVLLYTEDFNREYMVESMIYSRPQVAMRPVLGLKFTRRFLKPPTSTDYWASIEQVEMKRGTLHVQFHITCL